MTLFGIAQYCKHKRHNEETIRYLHNGILHRIKKKWEKSLWMDTERYQGYIKWKKTACYANYCVSKKGK